MTAPNTNLMKIISQLNRLIVLLLSVLSATLATAQDLSTDANGRFAAIFPAGAAIQRDSQVNRMPDGRTVRSYSVYTYQNNATHMVVWCDYAPGSTAKGGGTDYVRRTCANGIAKGKGHMRSMTEFKLGHTAGTEVIFDTAQDGIYPPGVARIRLYMIGDRLFQAIYLGPVGSDGSPLALDFLDSFRLLDDPFPVAAAREPLGTQGQALAELVRANALLAQNRLTEAEDALLASLRYDPKYPDAINGLRALGDRMFTNNRFSDAERIHRTLTQLNSNDAVAFDELGMDLDGQAKYPEAIIAYKRAIKLTGGTAEYYTDWGRALANSGHYAEALELYAKALRLEPNNRYTLNNQLWAQQRIAQAASKQ